VLHHLATATVGRQHSSATTVFAFTVWATLIVLVWLLPAIVAYRRGVPNAGSIVVLNVFFGWMPVVWVLCLALARGARPCPPASSATPVATQAGPVVVAVAPPTAAVLVAVIVLAMHPTTP
jgi:hypothetical protein